MTRKHFEVLANTIRHNGERYADQNGQQYDVAARFAIMMLAEDMADALAGICPKFDRSRFMQACRGDADERTRYGNDESRRI